MSAATTARSAASRLATSRRTAACGEEGLATAFRRASAEGLVDDYDDLDDYLDAVLEGDVEDVLREAGWLSCLRPGRCRRTGRCTRRAG